MTDWSEPGIWEELLTEGLARQLPVLGGPMVADLQPVRAVDAADRLSRHLAGVVVRLIEGYPEDERATRGVALVRHIMELLPEAVRGQADSLFDLPDETAQVVEAILGRSPAGDVLPLERPLTPLLDTTLLTNAPGEPRLAHELLAEVHSARSIDVVIAFIRRSGILPLLGVLRRHCEQGRRLRVLTTTYTGSTEARALDDLAGLGAEVKVSYDISSTRRHAKAWLFHRAPTTTTAYIGSSNLTNWAQVSGLEWNVRVSSARNGDVIAKMSAVFDSYWENRDFLVYDPADFRRRSATNPDERLLLLSPIQIELRPFQEALLERVALARNQGQHHNLLVSATGTGKTVMAAVDYARLRHHLKRSRLLFVAHREEILEQSRSTFRHALRDASFGETWVRGRRPQRFDHVFASVQSLAASDLANLDPRHFDVVIVDEFHHAAALTYRTLLDHLQPVELLGLTATPERTDGLDVLRWFDGRISAELRLWDAIAEQHLVPFSYFGIHDGIDLSTVPWQRGQGYDPNILTGILTADHAWAHRVIEQVRQKVTDPERMRALGFCVTINHAQFMAARFNDAGLSAVAVWGDTPAEERRAALSDLEAGKMTIVFTVDLFNEGIDVPSVDTLLFLRPTDSATLFLQQLGRGLRRSHGKPVCTVLDFVGRHRREFRFDRRFRALLGGTRLEIEEQVKNEFPYLPAGCSIDLDPVAQEIILRSIRNALPTTWRARQDELCSMPADATLAGFLERSGLELPDIYANNRSWSELRRVVGLPTADPGPHEAALLRLGGRLLHVDDPERIAAYRALLRGPDAPDLSDGSDRRARLARMLLWSLPSASRAVTLSDLLDHLGAHPQVRSELIEVLDLLPDRIEHLDYALGVADRIPLRIHARYTRIEILAAFAHGQGARPPTWREGVRWDADARCDLLAFTLDKSAGTFSPTTRYRDYALSPELIHWESQFSTSLASKAGRRYLNHAQAGNHVILFARLNTAQRAFWCLGPATYVRHEGERPIAITWRLHHRLPADLYTAFAAAVA